MSTTTAADRLVEVLLDWGVDVIFGLPGDGINGLMEALRKRQEQIRFIQVRHEESAAFMACGYAKFTGRLGVCVGATDEVVAVAEVLGAPIVKALLGKAAVPDDNPLTTG
jgi:thiamine pyrophosphate-dependent acetolactate synthase large subunit-like protein